MIDFEYRFGPQFRDDGTVFRLWAPAARSVTVEIAGSYTATVPMQRNDDGWFFSDVTPAADGDTYTFCIDDQHRVPDPASRQQAADVHGASVLRSPHRSVTQARRRWHEMVVYETHVGTATEDGTFLALRSELPRLAELGVTAIELMPVADFPGRWNWGYDGVLPFAPDRRYGTPEDLRAFVDAAHEHNLAVWLDVVYNHFGPEGNYLHLYAPTFFSDEITTPWGAGIDFRRDEVRRFFIENSVYWITEFGFDGLRFDAVHAIVDRSVEDGGTHFLNELSRTIRTTLPADRSVSLVLENDRNEARFLDGEDRFDAQWNDDVHHTIHVLLTGEQFGYYGGFQGDTEGMLRRALAEGFVYQGETPPGSSEPRGERSDHLSPLRFLSFIQNHDQIGNRAWGDRLAALVPSEHLLPAVTLLLLSPQVPMVFMGEEFGSTAPFQFFCDFDGELADAVRTGRRREFGLDDIPDPVSADTFRRSRPNDTNSRSQWTAIYTRLLHQRHRELVPLLPSIGPGSGVGGGKTVPVVSWPSAGYRWCIAFNLTGRTRPLAATPDESVETTVIAVNGGPPSTPALAAGVPPTAAAWTTYVWRETV